MASPSTSSCRKRYSTDTTSRRSRRAQPLVAPLLSCLLEKADTVRKEMNNKNEVQPDDAGIGATILRRCCLINSCTEHSSHWHCRRKMCVSELQSTILHHLTAHTAFQVVV